MVITKGSLVEVSSDDPGYHGAWYVATFVDEVEKDHHQFKQKGWKNRKKLGYLVRFASLFEESNPSEPLTEIVDPWFVRPSPPRYPRRNNANNQAEEEAGDFELYDVVDAYHRDGWWMGVLTKAINNDHKYIVSFESPPEEVEFERSELRLHVDWVDGRWEVPPKKETCEVEAGKSSQKRKRGRPPKSPIEMPNGLLQGGSRPSDLDHGDEPSENPAIVNDREYQQDWPFIKQSPIWATIESLKLYQNPPQKPHFSPLKKVKEDSREGLAIAQMVIFANVVQRTSQLKLDDPKDMIDNRLETLVELETHGFDVGAIRARLNELLSRKSQVGELKDKLKQVEEDLGNRNLEKSKIDEEICQLEGQLRDLQEKLVESVKKKNMKDKEIMMLQSNLNLLANQIIPLEGYCEKVAASPW